MADALPDCVRKLGRALRYWRREDSLGTAAGQKVCDSPPRNNRAMSFLPRRVCHCGERDTRDAATPGNTGLLKDHQKLFAMCTAVDDVGTTFCSSTSGDVRGRPRRATGNANRISPTRGGCMSGPSWTRASSAQNVSKKIALWSRLIARPEP